ncbi:MAG: acetyl-CoA carboxylase, carboxyltransferase subunit beta, partial [Bacteroidota bacterium]
PTALKKEIPEGLWYKTQQGKLIRMQTLRENAYVSPEDGYHVRIGSREYFSILFDNNQFEELDAELTSGDPLHFVDKVPYADRLVKAQQETQLKEAVRAAHGHMQGQRITIACMDFSFIGGSMGSVVGEKIARAIDYALQQRLPLLIISKSGGARMMEGSLSLMQMAKTATKLSQLAAAQIPYISLLTDPTTGGVSASFAMLGDINMAEPGALIGFAGPKVIKETVGKSLPKGFQKAEFLLARGFLDCIVDRRALKSTLTQLLQLLKSTQD